MTRVPICNLVTWKFAVSGRHGLSMRPTLHTALSKLGWTVIWALIALGIGYGVATKIEQLDERESQRMKARAEVAVQAEKMTESMRDMLEPEDFAELERSMQERQRGIPDAASPNFVRTRAIYTWTRTVGVTLFAAFAFMPLLSLFFGRLVVGRDPRGNLTVVYRNYVPHSRLWPKGSFDCLAVFVTEDLHYSRKWGIQYRGWVWLAQPQRAAQPSVPMLGNFAIANAATGPVFLLDRQKFAPTDVPPLPDRVLGFATAFQKVTGLPFGEPIVAESNLTVDRQRRGTIRRSFSVNVGEPEVTRSTYGSLDDVPPELRAQFDALMDSAESEGDGLYTSTTHRITIVDDSGETQVYDSVDDLPPEFRDRMRKFL